VRLRRVQLGHPFTLVAANVSQRLASLFFELAGTLLGDQAYRRTEQKARLSLEEASPYSANCLQSAPTTGHFLRRKTCSALGCKFGIDSSPIMM
jgi:hypothetical protein